MKLKDEKIKLLLGNTVLVHEVAKRIKSSIVVPGKKSDDGYERVSTTIVQKGENCIPLLNIGDKPIFSKYAEPDCIFRMEKSEVGNEEFIETLFVYNVDDKIIGVE